MAHIWARFCPNLNTREYRESLNDKKQNELDQRQQNCLEEQSVINFTRLLSSAGKYLPGTMYLAYCMMTKGS